MKSSHFEHNEIRGRVSSTPYPLMETLYGESTQYGDHPDDRTVTIPKVVPTEDRSRSLKLTAARLLATFGGWKTLQKQPFRPPAPQAQKQPLSPRRRVLCQSGRIRQVVRRRMRNQKRPFRPPARRTWPRRIRSPQRRRFSPLQTGMRRLHRRGVAANARPITRSFRPSSTSSFPHSGFGKTWWRTRGSPASTTASSALYAGSLSVGRCRFGGWSRRRARKPKSISAPAHGSWLPTASGARRMSFGSS